MKDSTQFFQGNIFYDKNLKLNELINFMTLFNNFAHGKFLLQNGFVDRR